MGPLSRGYGIYKKRARHMPDDLDDSSRLATSLQTYDYDQIKSIDIVISAIQHDMEAGVLEVEEISCFLIPFDFCTDFFCCSLYDSNQALAVE